MTSRNQGLSARRQGRKRREGLGTRLAPNVAHFWLEMANFKARKLKAPANEESLLRKHCCGRKCFPVCARTQHLLQTQQMFLNFFRNILRPQQMFPRLLATETLRATMFPQQLFPRLRGLNRPRASLEHVILFSSIKKRSKISKTELKSVSRAQTAHAAEFLKNCNATRFSARVTDVGRTF